MAGIDVNQSRPISCGVNRSGLRLISHDETRNLDPPIRASFSPCPTLIKIFDGPFLIGRVTALNQRIGPSKPRCQSRGGPFSLSLSLHGAHAARVRPCVGLKPRPFKPYLHPSNRGVIDMDEDIPATIFVHPLRFCLPLPWISRHVSFFMRVGRMAKGGRLMDSKLGN